MAHPMKKYVWLLGAGLGAWALNTLCAFQSAVFTDAVSLALLVFWGACVLWLRKKANWTPQRSTEAVLTLGFILGLVFIIQLHHLFSWHDLASYSADFSVENKPDGHLGYIAYLVEYGHLPTEDPRIDGFSVFYNPPLYHILQACFMKLNLLLGLPEAVCVENLQVFTLVCGCACTMVVVDLLRLLGMKEVGVRTGALLMVAQPMMLLLSATLNTDMLSTLFCLLCFLFTAKWLKTQKLRHIIGIALSLGLGMATKISNALFIPVLTVVFATVFFKNLKNWKKFIGQYAAFLLLSVPEAIAWPVYHLIVYDMPFNYVRLPAETIHLGRYTLWQRFGIPNGEVIRSLFYSGIRKVDHNLWMQTLKTSMFDELTLFELGTPMWYAAYFAMALFALMMLMAAILFIRFIIRKNDALPPLFKGVAGGYAALLIAYYFKFCFDYPYVCSFNFRYILPILFFSALAFADYQTHAKRPRWLTLYVSAFSCFSMFVYGVYFLA